MKCHKSPRIHAVGRRCKVDHPLTEEGVAQAKHLRSLSAFAPQFCCVAGVFALGLRISVLVKVAIVGISQPLQGTIHLV